MNRRRRRKRRKRRSGCGTLLLLLILLLLILGYLAWQMDLFDRFFPAQEETAPEEPAETEAEQERVTPASSWEKFYYNTLTDEAEQAAYQAIEAGLFHQAETIELDSLSPDRIGEIFQMVLKDDPELFWCDGTAATTTYSGLNPYAVLTPGYAYDAETKEAMQDEIDAVVSDFLNGISEDASTYERIVSVYQWIVDTVDYDSGAKDNQNIYSVFVEKRSVCAGYSRATQYLLNRLGVFCTYVTGQTVGGTHHAWNLVRIGADYYHVDTTWGDPVFLTQTEGQTQSMTAYDYLCCDDTELLKTHTPDPAVALPACTHMEYNYYVQQGRYFTSYDKETIRQQIQTDIDGQASESVFKFADQSLYTAARDEILGELLTQAVQELGRRYGLSTVQYQYVDDAQLNKITLYWQYT